MDRKANAVLDTATPATYGLLVDGQWIEGAGPRVSVRDKFRLQPCATITTADAAQVRHAVDVAHAAFRQGAPVAYERGAGAGPRGRVAGGAQRMNSCAPCSSKPASRRAMPWARCAAASRPSSSRPRRRAAWPAT